MYRKSFFDPSPQIEGYPLENIQPKKEGPHLGYFRTFTKIFFKHSKVMVMMHPNKKCFPLFSPLLHSTG